MKISPFFIIATAAFFCGCMTDDQYYQAQEDQRNGVIKQEPVQETKSDKPKKQGKSSLKPNDKYLRNAESNTFGDRQYAQRAETEMQDVREMIRSKKLPTIDFDFNKDTIKPHSYETLNKIAEVIKHYPRIKIIIEGHTDHVGSYAYNDELSLMRAIAVKRYLAEQGARPDSMRTYGFGKRRMITQGTTKEDMALNRRVEFIITTRDWDAVF